MYKEIPFSQLFPYVYCVFMTRDLTCIESSDKKFPLVLPVGVLQGDHLPYYKFSNIQFTASGYRNGGVVGV